MFFRNVLKFIRGPVRPLYASKLIAIVSAMKIYTTLKKISIKTVYYEKNGAFSNRPTKIFGIEKSQKCLSKFSLKIQLKNVDLKKCRSISRYLTFLHNKSFWSRFFQSCVDFHGGDDGNWFPRHWSI